MKEKNNIKESFQSKFKDFEALPPSDGWQRIEETLSQRRKPILLKQRIWGAAAAIATLLIGSLFFLQTPRNIDQNVRVAQTTTEQDTALAVTENNTASQNIENSTIQNNTQADTEILLVQASPKVQNKKHTKRSYTETTNNTLPDNDIKEDSNTVFAEEPTKPNEPQKQEQISQAEAEKRMLEFVEIAEKEFFVDEESDLTQDPMTLAINAKGGLSPFQKTVNTPMTLRNSLPSITQTESTYGNNEMFTTNILPAKNISEMLHAQPVSFGITASKNLTDYLSIETGLVYTYLFSKLKNSNNVRQNQVTQNIHYLGIPLQINYNILTYKKFNFYASLGGMVEKDFGGEYKNVVNSGDENTLYNAPIYPSIIKIKQKNPQYSINAGVGVAYPILYKLNLYGKVGGSYYFDANNEYKTFYSDKKIVLDLNLGVRYSF